MDVFIIFTAQYLYLFAILIAAIFFFKQSNVIRKSMFICGLIIAPLAYILSRIAGYFYYDPRPFIVDHFVPLITHVADNGFPSDHVLFTGAIAMVVFFYNKKLSSLLWIFAVLIGVARIFVGVHHFTDIVGSIIIVFVSGMIYRFFSKKYDLR